MSIWDAVINNHADDQGDPSGSCASINEICPTCKKGILEYDGKLNLVCPVCHAEFSAGFT